MNQQQIELDRIKAVDEQARPYQKVSFRYFLERGASCSYIAQKIWQI